MRDRFDLSIELNAVPWRELRAATIGEQSATVRARVISARDRQLARRAQLNARLEGAALKIPCALSASGERILSMAMSRQLLSARGATAANDIAEALQFRA